MKKLLPNMATSLIFFLLEMVLGAIQTTVKFGAPKATKSGANLWNSYKMAKQDIRALERTRAANIVSTYEIELRDKLNANPYAPNAAQVQTIIERLEGLRKQIMGSITSEYQKPIKKVPGDFSTEEIEAAMEIMGKG